MEKPIDEGRLAQDAGLRIRDSHVGAMNEGRSYQGNMGTANAPSDVQAREFQTNNDARRARQVIEAIGFDEADFLAVGEANGELSRAESANARKVYGITSHMANQGARHVVNDAYMAPNEASDLMEQQAYTPKYNDGWGVVKQQARLRSGKTIPVFVVEDSLSGMTTGKRYRRHEVAEKIARVINATGNPEDPRIRMIDEAYEKHVQIMQNIGKAKKAIREGRTDKKGRLAVLEADLQRVNAKLGIH